MYQTLASLLTYQSSYNMLFLFDFLSAVVLSLQSVSHTTPLILIYFLALIMQPCMTVKQLNWIENGQEQEAKWWYSRCNCSFIQHRKMQGDCPVYEDIKWPCWWTNNSILTLPNYSVDIACVQCECFLLSRLCRYFPSCMSKDYLTSRKLLAHWIPIECVTMSAL